jgi:hypothetical protein
VSPEVGSADQFVLPKQGEDEADERATVSERPQTGVGWGKALPVARLVQMERTAVTSEPALGGYRAGWQTPHADRSERFRRLYSLDDAEFDGCELLVEDEKAAEISLHDGDQCSQHLSQERIDATGTGFVHAWSSPRWAVSFQRRKLGLHPPSVRVYSDKYLEDANSFAYPGGLLEGGRWSWYYPYPVVMLRESAPRRARFCYSADG